MKNQQEEHLFNAYLRDELTLKQTHQLTQLLENDPSCGERLVRYTQLTSSMISVATDLQIVAQTEVKPKRAKSLYSASFITKLSLIAALFIFALFILNPDKVDNTFKVTNLQSQNFKKGFTPQSKITLAKRDILEFTNKSGTRLVVEGPAKLTFISDKKVFSTQGKFTAFVAEENKGFILANPLKDVIDLSTAFACDIQANSLELHVLEGSVTLGSIDNPVINENEARSYKIAEGIEVIDFTPNKFHAEVPHYKSFTLPPFTLLNNETYKLALRKQVKSFSADFEIESLTPSKRPLILTISNQDKILQQKTIEAKSQTVHFDLKQLSAYHELDFKFIDPTNKNQTKISVKEATVLSLAPPLTNQVLIQDQRQWHYYQQSKAPPVSWYQTPLISKNWLQSQASFGIDRVVKTKLEHTQYPLYLKHRFSLNSTPTINDQLHLSMKVDDGAVVYLNGNELMRHNLPTGKLGFDTQSLTRINNTNEDKFQTFILPSTHLKKGINDLSVQVMQFNKESSDIYFDLKLSLHKP